MTTLESAQSFVSSMHAYFERTGLSVCMSSRGTCSQP